MYLCSKLHCTALYCTALYCTVHLGTTLHCTALCNSGLHSTVLCCTALHCTVLHCATLDYIALHCTALHLTSLHSVAQHCTELNCKQLNVQRHTLTISIIVWGRNTTKEITVPGIYVDYKYLEKTKVRTKLNDPKSHYCLQETLISSNFSIRWPIMFLDYMSGEITVSIICRLDIQFTTIYFLCVV